MRTVLSSDEIEEAVARLDRMIRLVNESGDREEFNESVLLVVELVGILLVAQAETAFQSQETNRLLEQLVEQGRS